MSATSAHWLKLAGLLTFFFAVGTPFMALIAGTIGLLTGLIVLIVPVYVLVAWATITSIFVCLCLWRRWAVAAGAVGCLFMLGPASGVASWYARELHRCEHALDPAKCSAYLNGSPLLPFFVGVCVVAALLGSAIAVVVAVTAQRSFLDPVPGPRPAQL